MKAIVIESEDNNIYTRPLIGKEVDVFLYDREHELWMIRDDGDYTLFNQSELKFIHRDIESLKTSLKPA